MELWDVSVNIVAFLTSQSVPLFVHLVLEMSGCSHCSWPAKLTNKEDRKREQDVAEIIWKGLCITWRVCRWSLLACRRWFSPQCKKSSSPCLWSAASGTDRTCKPDAQTGSLTNDDEMNKTKLRRGKNLTSAVTINGVESCRALSFACGNLNSPVESRGVPWWVSALVVRVEEALDFLLKQFAVVVKRNETIKQCYWECILNERLSTEYGTITTLIITVFILHCTSWIMWEMSHSNHLTTCFLHLHTLSSPRFSIISLPFKLVFFVPDVIGLIVVEELGDSRGQVAVDAVHVAGRGHDGAHVFVAVLDALVHLRVDKDVQLS